tara:strand:- start:463 stop:1224 length:762 start_codon:yes stop_codon:yes gene_type:complete
MTKVQMIEMLRLHHVAITSTQAELYIEMSANKIAEQTGVTKKTFLISSVAGQRWYDLDSTIMRVNKIYFNDVFIPKLIGDPLIDDDEITNPSDNSDTALATPTSVASNKRMWMFSDYDSDKNTSKSKRLGIVEKVNNAITRDGRTSDYQSCSITATNNIRVYATTFGSKFASAAISVDGDDAMLSTVGPLKDVPEEFHEVLLTGAIAIGYKYPPQLNMEAAQTFDNEFFRGIRRIKKYERVKYSTGFIKPQDF